VPSSSAFAHTLKLFSSSRFSEKTHGNLMLKTPYKFKKSYGGTLEPQTPHDAPWLHGPSLKKTYPRGVVSYYLRQGVSNIGG
jgi:hypothetical protein